jgi:hypothetical protein
MPARKSFRPWLPEEDQTAADMAERWARTFGGRQCGKNEAIRAAYEAHRGPKMMLSAEGTTLARLDATPERPERFVP